MQGRYVFIILLTVMGFYYVETISCGAILFGHSFMYYLWTVLDYLQLVPCIVLEQKQKRKWAKRPLAGYNTHDLFSIFDLKVIGLVF